MVGVQDAGRVLGDDFPDRTLEIVDVFEMLSINPGGKRRPFREFYYATLVVRALLSEAEKLKKGTPSPEQRRLLSHMDEELGGFDHGIAEAFLKWMKADGLTEKEKLDKLYDGVSFSHCSWEPLAVNPEDGKIYKQLHRDHLPYREARPWKLEGADEENDARFKVLAQGLERRRDKNRREVAAGHAIVEDLTSD